MNDNIILSMPLKIQVNIEKLQSLEINGWSIEWQNLAKNILLQLNTMKDNKEISISDYQYIHKKYLHSIGSLSIGNSDFMNFLIKK
jgi:hypothetical protein